MVEVRYFAWLRERVGTDRETIDSSASTVGELVSDLRQQSEAHDLVFSDLSAIRAAVDQELVDMDHPIANAREIAFFPPMTGG